MCDENLVSLDPVRLDRAACESVRLKLTSESMGCSASRGDGLQHEEALQHVIQMMRELKVKQIANIAARREGRRSREKHYGWAGVQGARAIAGGDAVLRRASTRTGAAADQSPSRSPRARFWTCLPTSPTRS